MASDINVFYDGIRSPSKTEVVEPGRRRGVPVFDKHDKNRVIGESESIPVNGTPRVRTETDKTTRK